MGGRERIAELVAAGGRGLLRRRHGPGSWRAIAYALAVHAVLFAVLFAGLRWSTKPSAPPIHAYVAEERAVVAAPPVPDAREEAERREREAKRTAEIKRQQEEQRRERELELKRKAEEERQRRAEAQRREEAAQKRRAAEQALKENLAAEERERAETAAKAARERAEAARVARLRSQLDYYTDLVRQRVSRSWIRPVGTAGGLKCTVFVRVAPGGEVTEVRILRASGDPAFDRSVVNAVHKAVPLPLPQDRELFEELREINFEFKPEG